MNLHYVRQYINCIYWTQKVNLSSRSMAIAFGAGPLPGFTLYTMDKCADVFINLLHMHCMSMCVQIECASGRHHHQQHGHW